MSYVFTFVFFFFQAEDGIRDIGVTGVQTCALPISRHIAKTRGVTRVESMAFLRARFPEGGEVEAQVDRKPFTTPWLCLLAASDPSILPPELSLALEHDDGSARLSAERSARLEGWPYDSDQKPPARRGAVLSLIGREYAMGKAFL